MGLCDHSGSGTDEVEEAAVPVHPRGVEFSQGCVQDARVLHSDLYTPWSFMELLRFVH